MKTTPANKIARLAIATALIAGSAGMGFASQTTSAKAVVAQVIELHAPNNATQTVTIWTSKTPFRSAGGTTAAKNLAVRTINLPAPNNMTQTATVWTTSTEKNIAVAPLK